MNSVDDILHLLFENEDKEAAAMVQSSLLSALVDQVIPRTPHDEFFSNPTLWLVEQWV